MDAPIPVSSSSLRRSACAVLLWLVAAMPAATAAPTFREVARAAGVMHAVEVHVGVAYCGLERQLVAFDLSKPETPQLVYQSRRLPGTPQAMDAAGNRLAVAAGDAGLLVFDTTEPLHPRRIGHLAIPGGARDVVLSDETAFVAAGAHGLRVIDLSDGAQPVEVGHFVPSGREVRSVAVSGPHVFVGQDNGLGVLDWAAAANPEPLGGVHLDGQIGGIAVEGTRALVAAGRMGAHVVDVSDPSMPEKVATTSEPKERVTDVAIDGPLAYIGSRTYYNDATEFTHRGELRVVDITDPAHPETVKAFGGDIVSVAVDGGFAVAASQEDDAVGYVTALMLVGAQPTVTRLSQTTLPGQIATPMRVRGEFLYTVDHALRKFDLSFASRPRLVWSVPLGRSNQKLQDVDIGDAYAYVAAGQEGLHVVRIHGPGSPIHLRTLAAPAYTVHFAGDHLYVGGGTGVRIYSLANAARPQLLGTIPSGWTAATLHADGARLYVGAFPGASLLIYDVSDAEHPSLIHTYEDGHSTTDLLVDGTLAILGDGIFGNVRFVDVTDAESPQPLKAITIQPAALSGLARRGTSLFVSVPTLPGGGLRRIDITDPAEPIPDGSFVVDHEFALGVAVTAKGTIALGTTGGLSVLEAQQDP